MPCTTGSDRRGSQGAGDLSRLSGSRIDDPDLSLEPMR
jgi:hypothetical protein